MDNAFVTPEALADYLSLPVEVIEDLSSSGIITSDCYFEVGEHRRYSISKVTDALLEYTKEKYRNNVKKIKNNKNNKEESECSCERLIFSLHLLEGITYSLAKYIDNIHDKFEELVDIIWDSDFNNSINAWKVEIESVLHLSDIPGDAKGDLSIVVDEIKKFEKKTNFNEKSSNAANFQVDSHYKYSEEIFALLHCLHNSKYDASIIIDWINEVNLIFEKFPKDFKNPWNLYISKED